MFACRFFSWLPRIFLDVPCMYLRQTTRYWAILLRPHVYASLAYSRPKDLGALPPINALQFLIREDVPGGPTTHV
jgi:hypothetical protein